MLPMNPALARCVRLCKHPAHYVIIAETQDHVTDQHTKSWQFCLRCGAHRWQARFRGKYLYPMKRVPWQQSEFMVEALRETT